MMISFAFRTLASSCGEETVIRDRKSTRLNSSHLVISYAVFCLKKKKTDSAEIITTYVPKKIVHPVAKADSSISPRLTRAATIAAERAHAHSREQCWHYVKEALV